MAVTFTAGTAVGSAVIDETSVVVPLPAGFVDGDWIMVASALVASTGGYTTTPAGYTVLLPNTDSVNGSTSAHAAIYIKKWASGDANPTLTFVAGKVSAQAYRVTGANAATFADVAPVVLQGPTASTTTLSAPSITIGTAGATLVTMHLGRRGTTGQAGTWTAPTGMTEVGQARSQLTTSTNPSFIVSRLDALAAGAATGTKDAVVTSGLVGSMGVSFAVKAAAGGTPPTPAVGTAAGTWTFTGTASGVAPVVGAKSGTAAGTWTFTGAAVGSTPTVAPAGGTLVSAWTGVPTGTAVTIKTRTSGATSVRLKVATNSALTTGVAFTSAAAPSASGYNTFTVTGLTAGTSYWYQVEVDGTPAAAVGSFATDTPATPRSFRVAFGSCLTSGNTNRTAFDNLLTNAPEMFLHLGDLYYGNSTSTSTATHRGLLESQIAANGGLRDVLRQVPTAYSHSDHDSGGNDWTGGPGVQTPAVLAAYAEAVPVDGTLPTGGIYHSVHRGRVKFIVTDSRSFKSPAANADDANKTMFGFTQESWIASELADPNYPVKVICTDVPYVYPTTAGDDKWGGYKAAAGRLVAAIASAGAKVFLIHGDAHSLCADNGNSASNTGGLAVAGAAPLGNTTSIKGGPYSQGTWPTSNQGTESNQHGLLDITDTGTAITIRFSGRDTTNTERVTLSKTYSVAAPPQGTATGTWSFAGTASGKAAPKATAGGSWTFAGTAVGKRAPKGTAAGTLAYTGTAAGVAPIVGVKQGTASGTWTFTGTAVGRRQPRAVATGTLTWAGMAVGAAPGAAPPYTPHVYVYATLASNGTSTAVLHGDGTSTATVDQVAATATLTTT